MNNIGHGVGLATSCGIKEMLVKPQVKQFRVIRHKLVESTCGIKRDMF